MALRNIFIQDTGCFDDQFLVVTGLSPAEVLNWCKEEGILKKIVKLVEEGYNEKAYEMLKNKVQGGQTHFAQDSHPFLVVLGPYRDTWQFWEVVLHEMVHVVQCIRKKKGLEDEIETEAYMTEWLFRSIRRKLQSGEHKVPLKKKQGLTKSK